MLFLFETIYSPSDLIFASINFWNVTFILLIGTFVWNLTFSYRIIGIYSAYVEKGQETHSLHSRRKHN